MKLQEIEERVELIKKQSVDGELTGPDIAHVAQDKLYEDFIEYVRTSSLPNSHLRKKAELVLSVKDIEFERYYS